MKINSPKFDGDRKQLQCSVELVRQGHGGGRREKGRQGEGRALMNNSPLCALLLLLIFAYAQGNHSAVQLTAPPCADLHSTPLNQASIL